MRPEELEPAARARRRRVLAMVLLAIFLVLLAAFRLRKFIPSSWWLPTALVATSILLLLFLWHLPRWQVRFIARLEAKERFDRENEARETLSQIVGGLVLLVGFYFTWQNLELTRENQTDAHHLTFQGQITDRFTKAIAQLGDNKLELRLGGIYALEGIAKESTEDHWPIMEVLTAYVREHAKPNTRKKVPRGRARSPVLAEDIQAALTVIGRRTPEKEGSLLELDLRNAYLVRAELFEANLSGAVLD